MKSAVIAGSAVVGLIMLLAVMLFACPKGSFEWNGECAVDIQPQLAPPVQPSDEKPPEEKMPSWQRAEVTIATATNMALSDEKADQDKADAIKEGKHRARIK